MGQLGTFPLGIKCPLRNVPNCPEKGRKKMKEKTVKKPKYDKGQIFIKVMAGFLALLMVFGMGATLIFALI